MVTIVQKDDLILRQTALPVPAELFGTPKLRGIIRDMKAALNSQDDGVAIAAPQIGVSLRIFIVSKKIFEILYPEKEGSPEKQKDIVFINPEIVKLSKERAEVEEGCLSVRYLYGKIERAKKAKVCAQDEKGNVFEMGGSGLLAQIFQHETDHLEGRLFIDNATDLRDLPPDKDIKNE
jgi:peptide deformylase